MAAGDLRGDGGMSDQERSTSDSLQDHIESARQATTDIAMSGKDLYDRIQGVQGQSRQMKNMMETGSLDGGLKTGHAAAAGGASSGAGAVGQMSSGAAGAVGKEAAATAASSGTSAAAAGGTAGAAAGSVGGPPGAAIGAVVGAALSFLGKPIIRAIIVIVVFVSMAFVSLPSAFFEEEADVINIDGTVIRYEENKLFLGEKFDESLDLTEKRITEDMPKDHPVSGYDEVNYHFVLIPPREQLMQEFMKDSDLLLAMFELKTDNWKKATMDDFRKAVNKNSIWNNAVNYEYTGNYREEVSYRWEYNPITGPYQVSIIDIYMDYDITDVSAEKVRASLGIDLESKIFAKAVEMAYNMKVYMGDKDAMPPGGIYPGYGGTLIGGGTHAKIREMLAAMTDEEKRDFFGGSAIIPVASYHRISSWFGPRDFAKDPMHTGIDFSADSGTDVYASMDGIVLAMWNSPKAFGLHIVLYHGGEVTTMYAHLSGYKSGLKVGDRVDQGDVIGYVGHTGMATGDHLHYEHQIKGTAYNPVSYLPPL
jgi:murein DD-endopeptidase MepM/ murein hydrolase activator NlpD